MNRHTRIIKRSDSLFTLTIVKAETVSNNLCHPRGSPQVFQSNFGPIQERDKWRVPL